MIITVHSFCKMLKKYSDSRTPSSGRSVQCTAFLILSVPNLALRVLGRRFLAISGSAGPAKSLKALTAFSYLTSSTMHGPVVMCSVRAAYSGATPLYTSKNSSAVGLSRVNISRAEISNPSSRMMSMIFPASPFATACGLIMHTVQLLKTAVAYCLY